MYQYKKRNIIQFIYYIDMQQLNKQTKKNIPKTCITHINCVYLGVVRHSKTEPNKMKVREEKLRTIIEWSEKNEDVRVLLLTSSLVNPLALVDEFSDLDIEFVFEDNTNYISDKSWTLKFGNPIAMIEEDESCFNHKHAMKMLLYEDGVKVDFKL